MVNEYLDAVNLVRNSTADVAIAGEIMLAATVRQFNNQLKLVGGIFNSTIVGIVCNKNKVNLCCALVNAINFLINEGIYKDLLQRYSFNYTNNAICSSRINLQGSTCASMCIPRNKQLCMKNLN
ncbi:unnamed protein product [Rotaria sp. Silwood1]|nr:unnamed protein product [Rotaria sp. Silwood1]CAF1652075.1 unnamed protein product [Rotaria sp. Silwood1]